MNAFDMARMAYAPQSATMRSPQSIEFEAFARVTRNLRQADCTDRSRFVELAAAVHENRKLWGVLATCVADSSNALPPELRARIFYLFEFTDQHSAKVLRHEADTSILVEINTAVMRGLRSEGAAA